MVAKKQQGGFTLVEIAIVLVIIGVLLGGALKGQELIQNSRINDLRADYQAYTAALVGYQDRYNALPGDDDEADANHGGTNATGTNAGNGLLNNNWNSTTNTHETRIIWQQLRSAGFVAGTGFEQPQHAFGGIIGFDDTVYNIDGLALCFDNVSGENARAVDVKFDDGVATTGTIQGSTATAAYNINAAAVDICMEVE